MKTNLKTMLRITNINENLIIKQSYKSLINKFIKDYDIDYKASDLNKFLNKIKLIFGSNVVFTRAKYKKQM